MQTDLEVVIKDRSLIFSEGDVKAYMQMVLQGINFCHKRWVLHRDIKPNNFLISQQGMHSWSLTRGSAQLSKFLTYLVFSVCDMWVAQGVSSPIHSSRQAVTNTKGPTLLQIGWGVATSPELMKSLIGKIVQRMVVIRFFII